MFEPVQRDAGGLRVADVEVGDDLAGGVEAGFADGLAETSSQTMTLPELPGGAVNTNEHPGLQWQRP